MVTGFEVVGCLVIGKGIDGTTAGGDKEALL